MIRILKIRFNILYTKYTTMIPNQIILCQYKVGLAFVAVAKVH
jgi:hypothetical protein